MRVSLELVMVSLAFHLFVVGTVILLCALMTVVVDSFVADSSLLDCCDLVILFVCLFLVFFHLMLAGRQPYGVLRWFQLFCFFHLVSAVCLPDRGSHFSFATSICGLVFLSLPQAFVVCSFFLCRMHLCTASFFHGLFCRRHSC